MLHTAGVITTSNTNIRRNKGMKGTSVNLRSNADAEIHAHLEVGLSNSL